MKKWYKKPVGKALLKSELVGLTDILPQIFGYYIMQMGSPTNNSKILKTSPIHNRIIADPDTISNPSNGSLMIQCQPDELPFLPESIDAIVLFHILEFAKNPKAILKEIYTTLMPNGYVIIFGFNPYSLWGMAHLWTKTKETPWLGNWISPGHLRQWLSKIGFHIGDYKTFYFRPSGNNSEKLLFLEGIGQIFWPYWGASYMFVAQKTVIGLTPIKPFSFTKYFKTVRALPKTTSNTTQCNKN